MDAAFHFASGERSRKRRSTGSTCEKSVEDMVDALKCELVNSSIEELLTDPTDWLVRDLRALADALEDRSLKRYGVCPAGHALTHKEVTGSLVYSKKSCSCCSTQFLQGMHRFSCKQCNFHLCTPCYNQEEPLETLDDYLAPAGPYARKSQRRKTENMHQRSVTTSPERRSVKCKTHDASDLGDVRSRIQMFQEAERAPARTRCASVDRPSSMKSACAAPAVASRPTEKKVAFAASITKQEAAFKADTEATGGVEPAMAMPIQETRAGWCVKGVFERQALKFGLRQLSTRPHVLQEPESDKPRKTMLKERLLLDIASGRMPLATVHPSDLNAAQRDVKLLSVIQLLQISVMYDSSLKGAQGEFMIALENALYEKIGVCAVQGAELDFTGDADDRRRIGREAVLLVAAGAAIPSSPVWSWWVMEGRIFFDTQRFASVDAFPKDGVLEFSDYSKVERFAGKCIDWQVRLVTDASDLISPFEHKRRRTSSMEISQDAITRRRATLKSTGVCVDSP